MDLLDRLTLTVLAEQAPLTPLALLEGRVEGTESKGMWAVFEWRSLLICPRCAGKVWGCRVALAPPQPRFRRPCCLCKVTLNPV